MRLTMEPFFGAGGYAAAFICTIAIVVCGTTTLYRSMQINPNADYESEFFFHETYLTVFNVVGIGVIIAGLIHIWRRRDAEFDRPLPPARAASGIMAPDNGLALPSVLRPSPSEQLCGVTEKPAVVRTPCMFAAEHAFAPLQLVGVVIFAAAGVAYNVIRIYDIVGDVDCFRYSFIGLCGTQLVFLLLQACCVVRFSRLVFVQHATAVQVGIMVLFAINMCTWIHTVIHEVMEGIAEMDEKVTEEKEERLAEEKEVKEIEANFTCVQSKYLFTSFAPYLAPAVIEFTLLTSTILIQILMRCGKSEEEKETVWGVGTRFHCMHRSRGGLAGGVAFLTITLFVIVIFYIIETIENMSHVSYYVFICQELSIIIFSLIAIAVIFTKTRPMQGRRSANLMDLGLLFLGFAGSVGFYALMLQSSISSIQMTPFMVSLCIGTKALEILEILMQTVLIFDLGGRCVSLRDQRNSKPGRSVIGFLIGLNYAMWMMATFEIKKTMITVQGNVHQNISAASIVKTMFVTLPLLIFYRFHSAVCLSDIWLEMYK